MDSQLNSGPEFLAPRFTGIPDELKQLKNWVVWRYLPPKSKGRKWRKVPFQPNSKPASSTDSTTWSSFEECRSAYERGGFSGVGFVFDGKPDENGLVYAGVDFDSAACSGEISIETAEWVDRLGSYVETSVSGTGVHVILKANPLASGIAADGIELYTTGRYFTMTGCTPGSPNPIVAAPAEFAALATQLQASGDGSATSLGSASASPGTGKFQLPGWVVPKAFADLPHDRLSDGLEANIEEVRSAVAAIPPLAIAPEPEWMTLARALAHEAALFPHHAHELWNVLDGISGQAPGYDAEDNWDRFQRYIREALDRAEPITIATVFHLATQHGWEGIAPPLIPSAPVSGWSAADLQVSLTKLPHRRWLYGTHLIRGEITVLAAPGGVGKTALATGMAVEIATGTTILDERIYQAHELKVLCINGEDSSTEIQRRIYAFCLAHADKLKGKYLDRLYVAGADHPQVQRLSFLQTTGKNLSMVDRSGFEVLGSALDTLKPDLLVLDPLVAFCSGGNMNDNALMAQVMRELKRLAIAHDCAVLVVHHTRKGAEDGNPEAISGASATVNLARRALMPALMTAEDAKVLVIPDEERFRYFKLVDAKSNLAPRAVQSPWYKLHSITIPNPEPPVYPFGDSVQAIQRVNLVQVATRTTDDQTVRGAILAVIQRGKLIDGDAYPYSPSGAGANNQRGILEDAMAAVKEATPDRQWASGQLQTVTEGTIKKMKSEGLIVEKDINELMPNRKRKRFRTGRGLTAASLPSCGGHFSNGFSGPTGSTGNHRVQLSNSCSID